MKKRNVLGHSILYLVLAFFLAICVFPLVYTISASFKTNAEILSRPDAIFPINPTINNYIDAWNSEAIDIKSMTFHSLIYTIVCVAASLINSTMGGYVFSRGNFKGKKIVFTAFSMLMFFSMGSVTVYPMFDILNLIHMPKSLYGLMFIKVFAVAIINIYLVKGYVDSLPKELDEAAMIDGCNFIQTFFKIHLPLLKPIIATIGVLAFQGSWNEYLMPMVFTMSNPSQRPLIVGIVALSKSGESAANWNLVLAGTTISLVPVLIVYAIGNRYFVSGLTAGAVKG